MTSLGSRAEQLAEGEAPETVEICIEDLGEYLRKDKGLLFTFYDFPSEHWTHIRTTNAIESTFGTIRHRTRQTKGCGSRVATLTMVFKLATQAEKHWRRMNGYKLISKVMEGVEFVDGQLKKAA